MRKLLAWRLTSWWVRQAVPAGRVEEVLGDLREDFERERGRRGRLACAWWLIAETLSVAAAYRRAARERRSLEQRMTTLAAFLRQFKLSARSLRRSPGYAIAAALTLGVGIGATSAVFSIVQRALLEPLPYPNAARLVAIGETRPTHEISVSYLNFLDWQRQARSFEALALFEGTSLTLPGDKGAERVRALFAGPDLFRVLGTSPATGRSFTADEQQPGGPRVAIIGDGLWRRHFGADPHVLSTTLDFDGEPYTIVGVMPPGFDFPGGIVYGAAEVYLPLGVFLGQMGQGGPSRGSHPGLEAIGLLRPGVSIGAARVELDAIAGQLRRSYPEDDRDIGVVVRDGVAALVGDLGDQLRLVAGAVVLVLLIAMANVAGLALTRSASRARDIAVHAALGAPAWQRVWPPIAETLLVAAGGGLIGAGLAAVVLTAVAPAVADLPRLSNLSIDWRVYAGSLVLAAVTGVCCGLVPALWAGRAPLDAGLRQRGGSSGARGRGALVVVQVAFALVLLLCAGALASALGRLASDRGGVRPDGTLTFDVALPPSTPPDRTVPFFDALHERVRALPGVTAVGAISVLPFSGSGMQSEIARFGEPAANGISTDVNSVTPDYFAAMGVSLQRGRMFTRADTATSPAVAVVDERLAARFWPGADPIGRHVQGWGFRDLEVVGVVTHVTNYGVAAPSREELYVPLAQRPRGRMFTVIRATGDPTSLVAGVRAAVAVLDGAVAIGNVRTMGQWIDGTIAGTRIASLLSVAFAAAALTLAVVGLSGLVAYIVQLRRREIGIRLALGADRRRVVGEVLAHASKLTLAGMVVGVAIGLVALRALQSRVSGITGDEPAVIVGVPLGLLVMSVLVSWWPARRAARVSPTVALRDE